MVFVTAYDQYAIDAFEHGAVDYLLKPIGRERLQATGSACNNARLPASRMARCWKPCCSVCRHARPLPVTRRRSPRLTASSGRETRLIALDEVAYFQADQKYTTVMTAAGEAVLRTPLRELLDVLDPQVFKQIHRSTIVNMKAVASVVREDTGKGRLALRGRSETLTVSQPFMSLFRGM